MESSVLVPMVGNHSLLTSLDGVFKEGLPEEVTFKPMPRPTMGRAGGKGRRTARAKATGKNQTCPIQGDARSAWSAELSAERGMELGVLF